MDADTDVVAEGPSPAPTPQLVTPPTRWETISSVKMNDLYLVSKYRCSETGMDLVHARVDGPHVHCYWIVPHKLEDNHGIPHLLQHLLWHGGSKHFPVPGLFHRISSKCFASAPKAWVDRDHSCYQITTAGKEGFLTLLPVIIDHVFQPLLPEATFTTEIFYVDGNGGEHGICYEETLAMEQDPDVISTMELLQIAFGSDSSYKFPYAGSSESIRTGTVTLDMVKAFHEKFYRPSNSCMVVVGDLVKEDMFSAVNPILDNLIKQMKSTEWKKLWVEEPLIKTPDAIVHRTDYPSHNQSPAPVTHAGAVKVGIVGPPSTTKLNRCVAMRLILEYIMAGPLSLALASQMTLNAAFSHQKIDEQLLDPIPVTLTEYEFKQTVFTLEFHNVPVDLVQTVPVILRKTLEKLVHEDDFNQEEMMSIVERCYQLELDAMENFAHDKIVRAVIPDYLYSNEDSDLMFDRRINSAYTIHHFLSQTAEFWKHVIEACFLDENWLTVAALPNKSLYDNIIMEKSSRVTERLNSAHIKETKRWAQKFKVASKMISKKPPVEYLDKFPLPSISSIGNSRIMRQDNPEWAKDTLCNLYVDDINSNHAFLTIIMDTSELTLEEKKYLVLFSEGLLNSPCVDNKDVLHSAEEVQREMSKDVLKCETFFGLEWLGNLQDRTKFSCGSYPHLFCLRFEMDVTKVKEGFKWAQLLLWNTKFDKADKLKEVAARLVREIELELKKQGPVMTRALLTDSLYLMNSTPKAVSLVRQSIFLRREAEKLSKSSRLVSKMLEAIRMTILRPENVTVHVAASLTKMEFFLTEDPNARDAISNLFRQTFDYTGWHWGYETKRLSNIPDINWMRSADCIARCSKEQILRMNGELGYLIQAAPGIRSYNHYDYPYLLTALQYFIQSPDGPIYKQLVGEGLAEVVDIRVSPTEGIILFEMRGCVSISSAYGKAYDIIAKHLGETKVDGEDGSRAWDELLLASAKSSMILRLTQHESTPTHIAMCSLLSYYKGIQLDNNRKIMEEICTATMEGVQAVAKKYFKPLFLQPCTCAASAPTENAIPIIKDLMERCGKRVSLIPPVEQSFMASFNT